MYQVGEAFKRALRQSHTLHVQVDAYQGIVPVVIDLPITGGAVTVSAGDGVRRTLDLTVADPALWDTLRPAGTELYAYRGIRFPDGSIEKVPLGVFSCDAQAMSLARDGGITLSSCPDRWSRVQRARFATTEVSTYTHPVRDEIVRLVQGSQPGGVMVRQSATSTTRMIEMIYSRDRDQEVQKLCTDIGAEAFFDHTGQLVVRNVPGIADSPVWTIDASATGVMVSGNTSRDRSRTFNIVVVSASNTDGYPAFPTQVVEDLNPASDTFVGGPFGRVPFFWSTPVLRSVTAARKAGATILAVTRGTVVEIGCESVVNPALDRGDTIALQGLDGLETHIIDSVTIPLTVEGTQSITTRVIRKVPEESAEVTSTDDDDDPKVPVVPNPWETP